MGHPRWRNAELFCKGSLGVLDNLWIILWSYMRRRNGGERAGWAAAIWSDCFGWGNGWTAAPRNWAAGRWRCGWRGRCCGCAIGMGHIVPLEANAAQRLYERRRGRENIVLKARQMGISTWVAGRFFLRTITRPGTLTVEVAHNREAAEQIFRIVHRFYEQLPEGLREGVLRVSRANTGQLLFPELDSEYRVESAADVNAGRGMTVQNLHCSEVARWGGDVANDHGEPAGGAGAGRRAGAGVHAERRAWNLLRGVAAGVRDGHGAALFSLVDGRGVYGTGDRERGMDGGRAAAGGAAWADRGADRISAAPARELWRDGDAGIWGRCGGLFPGERQLRVRPGRDCTAGAGGARPLSKRNNGTLWIWYPPVTGHEYLLGVDPAGGGTDGDYAVVQVIDQQTGLQCAELRGASDPARAGGAGSGAGGGI